MLGGFSNGIVYCIANESTMFGFDYMCTKALAARNGLSVVHC